MGKWRQIMGHQLRRLFDFHGRDDRTSFWTYALSVFFGITASWMVAFTIIFAGIFAKIEQFAAAHPDQVTRTYGPGSYSIQVHGPIPGLMPDFTPAFGILCVLILLLAILLASAVTRRMHDRNRSGKWAVVPLLLCFSGMAMMLRLFTGMSGGGDENIGIFLLLFANNLVYLVTLVLLVVQLALPGTHGNNRFGPQLTN